MNEWGVQMAGNWGSRTLKCGKLRATAEQRGKQSSSCKMSMTCRVEKDGKVLCCRILLEGSSTAGPVSRPCQIAAQSPAGALSV